VVIAGSDAPGWIAEAEEEWGWAVISVELARPRLANLVKRPWFGELWSDCLRTLVGWGGKKKHVRSAAEFLVESSIAMDGLTRNVTDWDALTKSWGMMR
jgi:hypothetical protein